MLGGSGWHAGCHSDGETLAEVKANIRGAATLWLESQFAMAFRNVLRANADGAPVRTARRARART